jgi:hypothetical protein
MAESTGAVDCVTPPEYFFLDSEFKERQACIDSYRKAKSGHVLNKKGVYAI